MPEGFCPSFVTIEGSELIQGRPKSGTALPVFPVIPEPVIQLPERPWSILVTGIGGTGVVTIGHVLAMAAHLEGKGAALIDMAGLSQKTARSSPISRLRQGPKTLPRSGLRRAAAIHPRVRPRHLGLGKGAGDGRSFTHLWGDQFA